MAEYDPNNLDFSLTEGEISSSTSVEFGFGIELILESGDGDIQSSSVSTFEAERFFIEGSKTSSEASPLEPDVDLTSTQDQTVTSDTKPLEARRTIESVTAEADGIGSIGTPLQSSVDFTEGFIASDLNFELTEADISNSDNVNFKFDYDPFKAVVESNVESLIPNISTSPLSPSILDIIGYGNIVDFYAEPQSATAGISTTVNPISTDVTISIGGLTIYGDIVSASTRPLITYTVNITSVQTSPINPNLSLTTQANILDSSVNINSTSTDNVKILTQIQSANGSSLEAPLENITLTVDSDIQTSSGSPVKPRLSLSLKSEITEFAGDSILPTVEAEYVINIVNISASPLEAKYLAQGSVKTATTSTLDANISSISLIPDITESSADKLEMELKEIVSGPSISKSIVTASTPKIGNLDFEIFPDIQTIKANSLSPKPKILSDITPAKISTNSLILDPYDLSVVPDRQTINGLPLRITSASPFYVKFQPLTVEPDFVYAPDITVNADPKTLSIKDVITDSSTTSSLTESLVSDNLRDALIPEEITAVFSNQLELEITNARIKPGLGLANGSPILAYSDASRSLINPRPSSFSPLTGWLRAVTKCRSNTLIGQGEGKVEVEGEVQLAESGFPVKGRTGWFLESRYKVYTPRDVPVTRDVPETSDGVSLKYIPHREYILEKDRRCMDLGFGVICNVYFRYVWSMTVNDPCLVTTRRYDNITYKQFADPDQKGDPGIIKFWVDDIPLVKASGVNGKLITSGTTFGDVRTLISDINAISITENLAEERLLPTFTEYPIVPTTRIGIRGDITTANIGEPDLRDVKITATPLVPEATFNTNVKKTKANSYFPVDYTVGDTENISKETRGYRTYKGDGEYSETKYAVSLTQGFSIADSTIEELSPISASPLGYYENWNIGNVLELQFKKYFSTWKYIELEFNCNKEDIPKLKQLQANAGEYRSASIATGGYENTDLTNGKNEYLVQPPSNLLPLNRKRNMFIESVEFEPYDSNWEKFDAKISLAYKKNKKYNKNRYVETRSKDDEWKIDFKYGTIFTKNIDGKFIRRSGEQRKSVELSMTINKMQSNVIEESLSSLNTVAYIQYVDAGNEVKDESEGKKNTISIDTGDMDTPIDNGEYIVESWELEYIYDNVYKANLIIIEK